MHLNSKKIELGVREYSLIACSILLAFPSIGSLFGFYWLQFGGNFAYEGWHFIVYSVYFGAFFLPAAIYFYLWPKPHVNNRLRLICSIPFIIMVLSSLLYIWNLTFA
jgi:hypothetical protein